ncbi:hypothetical protein LZ31DRAFT_448567, partial [Colletotrichum somersetense]
SDGNVEFYGVSMYHQLHCLTMIRKYFTNLTTVNDGNRLASHEDHLLHCIDYLSQAAVCAADDTIEPARIKTMPSGKRVAVIDGLENPHYCANSQRLHELVEKSHSE